MHRRSIGRLRPAGLPAHAAGLLPGAARVGLLFAALLTGASAIAQTEGLRIGAVDFGRLIDQSPQARLAEQALAEEFSPDQRELSAMQISLQEKVETFQRDGAIMGETERSNLEREILELQRDFERSNNAFREDMNLRRNETIQQIQQALIQEVQIYSRAAGYDLVVANPLYYGGAVDITEEVLRRLEADFAAEDTGAAE